MDFDRRTLMLAGTAGLLAQAARAQGADSSSHANATAVAVDLRGEGVDFPHYWEDSVGSDRLAVGFREQWIKDLIATHESCGFKSMRCHGMFDDEMGICHGVTKNGLALNFSYIDQIYDRMLEIGVRPFVELSFMPTALASNRNAIFWYRGNTSPPKSMALWNELVETFARHMIQRYGIAEVSQWRFECWNEPNLSFWAGTQAQYFDLYKNTALTLKNVDRRLPVGGPATAQLGWISEFLAYCEREQAPVDFIASHIYPTDPQEGLFGKADLYPYEEVIPRALARAREKIRASAFKDIPLRITEWSSANPAFIAQTIRDCDGLAETFSYWTFSSIFEEGGPPRSFFSGSFGLVGTRGIPNPSLHAFTALHRLGARRLASSAGPVLATKRDDGGCAILAWNLIPQKKRSIVGGAPDDFNPWKVSSGEPKRLALKLGNSPAKNAKVTTIDPVKSSAMPAYETMGRPPFPTRDQIETLIRSAAMPKAETVALDGDVLTVDIPPNATVLIETQPA